MKRSGLTRRHARDGSPATCWLAGDHDFPAGAGLLAGVPLRAAVAQWRIAVNSIGQRTAGHTGA